MDEPTKPTDAQLMMDLFRGSDLAHGRSEMTKTVSQKGKHEAKSWMEKRPAGLEEWEAHLKGQAGLGIPPLASDNTVRWGAIDVDIYEGLSIEQLNQKVQEHRLPLVVCRSKSGGPHIYMFLQEPVPAALMIEKLDALAGFLGFGTSEIFPKQASIGTDGKTPDYGSWINMPYFGGTRFLRYGLDAAGNALPDVGSFSDFCRKLALTAADLAAFETPRVSEELFPDGPPCLNTIMAGKPVDFRNVILSNAAVYCRKAFGETWGIELDKINQRFPQPLGSAEVEAIKRSYAKKDYKYQCSKQPLCNFCESSKCKKTRFGIGGGDFLPTQRSLTMVDTDPPIWYLDLKMPDGKDRRISLSTEQLQNPRLFQRRAMETVHQMPPVLEMPEWETVVQGLMAHCSIIEVPPSMTPGGQFVERVNEFLGNRASTESLDDVLRCLPYRDAEGHYFRLKDLWAFLKQERFDLLKQHEMVSILRGSLRAVRVFKVVKAKGINLMMIPHTNATPAPAAQPLDKPTFPQPY